MQAEAAPMVHSVAASAWGGVGSSRTIPMLHIRRPVTSSSMAHSRVVGLVAVNTGIGRDTCQGSIVRELCLMLKLVWGGAGALAALGIRFRCSMRLLRARGPQCARPDGG